MKIIFNSPAEDKLPHFKAVAHFLAIAEEDDQKKTREMLDQWYLSSKKDYTVFASKYPPNESIERQKEKIALMYQWVNEQNIEFTPTFFLNGYQLPNAYSVEDLKYFLLEYAPKEKPEALTVKRIRETGSQNL